MDYVLSLSIPQLYYLQTQLASILKLENGVDKDNKPTPNDDANTNTVVMGATLAHMKKMCNKDSFTLAEMQNPSETIKKYQNLNA